MAWLIWGIVSTDSLLYLSRDMTKPTMWLCAQHRLRPRLIRVFAVHVKKPWVLSYPLSAQGGCPGWSVSSLGVHSFCCFCHVAARLSSCKHRITEILRIEQWSTIMWIHRETVSWKTTVISFFASKAQAHLSSCDETLIFPINKIQISI